MNNKWLLSFMAVAQAGSINAAARSLFISPQALLQQINLLEDEVGTALFIRQRSGMALTSAGREFLTGAQQIETIYATTLARCRLARKAEDTIRIPMMSSIILPEFMEKSCAEFTKLYGEDWNIEFLTDTIFEEWMDGLRDLRYDIIEHFAVDGLCPKGIHFEFLSNVPTWCVMSQFHPLAKKHYLIPEDFEGCLILSPPTNANLSGYLNIYFRNAGIKTKIEPIDNDRYKIIDGLNRYGIYLTNEDIARIFVGFQSLPMDFDNHVQHGLACREDMYETYKPFFDVAHTVFEKQTAK